jgi:hypothetical protein
MSISKKCRAIHIEFMLCIIWLSMTKTTFLQKTYMFCWTWSTCYLLVWIMFSLMPSLVDRLHRKHTKCGWRNKSYKMCGELQFRVWFFLHIIILIRNIIFISIDNFISHASELLLRLVFFYYGNKAPSGNTYFVWWLPFVYLALLAFELFIHNNIKPTSFNQKCSLNLVSKRVLNLGH